MKQFYRILIILSNLFAAAVSVVVIFILFLVPNLPDIESIKTLELKIPLRIYSSDGQLMGEYGSERRIPVRIEEAPPKLIAAILSAEDDRYYEHVGIDYLGILRAIYVNVQSGAKAQGASTITMQVARNFFLSPEQSYIRKAKEVLLALRLEQLLDKDQILELYLNKIFLGHRAYGFGGAATTYYGMPLAELNAAQFAMLAALPKAPSTVNPVSNPERALERRNYILDRMFELGYISEDEYAESTNSPVTAKLHQSEGEVMAPYVSEFVRQIVVDEFGTEAYEAGYKVYTTVNSQDQTAAVHSLREGLISYDRRHGFRGPVKKIDPSQISSQEQRLKAFGEVDSSREIVPAVVQSVQQDKVDALTKNGEQISILWEHMKWAKPYYSSRSVGAAPKSPSEFLSVGDVIHARPVVAETAESKDSADSDQTAEGDSSTQYEASPPTQWMLAQIPKVQGALISIQPRDGAIRAMTGGFDYYLGKFNRATQAVRPIGSSIKPFVYSAALNEEFTASTLVSGAPVVIEDESTEVVWKPENYSGKFFGPTRLRKALEKSVNLVSVRLIRGIGSEQTIDHISKFGFDRDSLPTGLSLALGSAQFTPIQVAQAYSVFANGGYLVEPYIIDVIKDRHGFVVARGKKTEVCTSCLDDAEVQKDEDRITLKLPVVQTAKRVISIDNAYIMYDMLHQVVLSGTARKAKSLNRNDLAGKTGTTNDFEDAWFSGFNGELVTTVWTGFDNPSDLGRHEAGSRVALPIWIEFTRSALESVPDARIPKPDNVIAVHVHEETGNAVPADHPNALLEYYVVGTQPVLKRDYSQAGLDPTSDSSTSESPSDKLF